MTAAVLVNNVHSSLSQIAKSNSLFMFAIRLSERETWAIPSIQLRGLLDGEEYHT